MVPTDLKLEILSWHGNQCLHFDGKLSSLCLKPCCCAKMTQLDHEGTPFDNHLDCSNSSSIKNVAIL